MKNSEINNIFSDIPDQIPEEIFEEVLSTGNFKIEKIVSKGHASPKNFWYDQDENEWIILLKGSAGLIFKGDDRIVVLKKGDYVNIPAHRKHQVAWTASNQETVWLAIFY